MLHSGGHLGGGFSVAGYMPVQDQPHDAGDDEDKLLRGIVAGGVVEQIPVLQIFTDHQEHGTIKKDIGQLVLEQGFQKKAGLLPVSEIMLQNPPDTGVGIIISQIGLGSIQEGMVYQPMETILLAAEIAVEGLAGDLRGAAQIPDGDPGIGNCMHQIQQVLLDLTLAPDTFFCAAVFVHDFPPKTQYYFDYYKGFYLVCQYNQTSRILIYDMSHKNAKM